MIREIRLDSEDMDEMLKNMPPHIRKKIEDCINELSTEMDAIDVLKQFSEQYEEDNHLDAIIAFACANIIKAIITVTANMNDKRNKKGLKGITGSDLGNIVSTCLRHEAGKIDRAMKAECSIHGYKN